MKKRTFKWVSALALSAAMVFTMGIGVMADPIDNGERPADVTTGNGAWVQSLKTEKVGDKTYEIYKDAKGTEYYVDGNNVYAKTNTTTPLTGNILNYLVPYPDGANTTPTKATINNVEYNVYKDANNIPYYVNGTNVYKRDALTTPLSGTIKPFLKGVKLEQDIQAAITKAIKTGVGTEVPVGMTFTFKFEQQNSVDGTAGTATDKNGNAKKPGASYDSQGNELKNFVPATDTAVAISTTAKPVTAVTTADMNAAGAGSISADNKYKTIAVQSGNFFDGITFPKAGVYVYKVTEYATNTIGTNYMVTNPPAAKTVAHSGNTTTVEETIHHNAETINGIDYGAYDEVIREELEYSQAEYTLYVYVDNKEAGGTYIYAAGIVFSKDDDGTTSETGENPALDSKTNPTPWTVTTPYTGDMDISGRMTFINEYTKYKEGEPEPLDKPNPKQQQLTVSKTVTGTGADQTKYFDFSVKLTKTDSANDTYYDAYVLDAQNNIVTSAANYAGTLTDVTTSSGATVKAIRFTIGQDGTVTENIKLKHGQHLAFLYVPVGTQFEAKETLGTDYADWTVSADVWTNGSVASILTDTDAAVVANTSKTLTTGTQLVGEKAKNGADFTNEYTYIPITGILQKNLGFIVMIAAAVAVLVVIAVVRAKLRKRV